MAEPKSFRYLTISQEGQPRIGPFTLVEYVQVCLKAKAYEDAWNLFVYGTDEVEDNEETQKRKAWIQTVLAAVKTRDQNIPSNEKIDHHIASTAG